MRDDRAAALDPNLTPDADRRILVIMHTSRWLLAAASLALMLGAGCSSESTGDIGTASAADTADGGCCGGVHATCKGDRDCCSGLCVENACTCSNFEPNGEPSFCAFDSDCCDPSRKCLPYKGTTQTRCQTP
jgi:hypothetical protein